MVVDDPCGAQIELILASDNRAQARELARDLKASRYAYAFVHLSMRGGLVEALRAQIARNGGRMPTVVVIDYTLAGTDCEALVRDVQVAARARAIECLVTHPPMDDRIRARLVDLGARLFDGDVGDALPLLTLH